MLHQSPKPPPAETDSTLHLVEVFLGAATVLIVELAVLLLPTPVIVGVLLALAMTGLVLAVVERTRWFGVGVMFGVAVPVLYVITYVK